MVTKMKKLFIITMFVFMLTSCSQVQTECKENELVGGVCVDTTKPEIFGVSDLVFERGERFDLSVGITAIDDLDGDITSDIEIEHQVNRNWPGEYIVKYKVKDNAGNEDIKVAVITIYEEVTLLDNLIKNSGFSNGFNEYKTYTITDSAEADFSVVNDELKITINSVTDNWWSPRFHQENIYFENGKTYHIQFDAKADDERLIHIQIGELLSAAPWFIDFNPDGNKLHQLTTEYQTFKMSFTMNKDSNHNGSVIFEMGNINGNNNITTIYIDNIEVREVK